MAGAFLGLDCLSQEFKLHYNDTILLGSCLEIWWFLSVLSLFQSNQRADIYSWGDDHITSQKAALKAHTRVIRYIKPIIQFSTQQIT
jgi:hypothetical protein